MEKTHTAPEPGVKSYKCSQCPCIFKKIASLNIHITKTHTGNDNMVTLMNQLKDLEQESVNVSENLPNTSFVKLAESFLDGSVRTYLVRQRKIFDVRWYICNYCTKEFKKPSDLIRHTRVHTKEKPFGVCLIKF